MLWDWLLGELSNRLLTPRNQGVLALAGALVGAGVVAGLLSLLRMPVWFARVAGAAMAVAVVAAYWPAIAVLASTTTTITTTVTGQSQGLRCGGIDPVLATIRQMESGGDYTAVSPDGWATGAYQFSDDTWAEWGGTGRAKDAPAAEQDERAREYVTWILDRHDVDMVPVQWFYPAAVSDPALLDYAPNPDVHNGMTVRDYQRKWLAAYEQQDCTQNLELVKIGQGGHKLRPDAAAGFAAWEAEYGGDIPITDSYRSYEHQAKRHAEEPGRFVAPEHSAHVSGNAVDVNMYVVDVPRLLAAAKATGWCQSALNNNEPWHFSYNECR